MLKFLIMVRRALSTPPVHATHARETSRVRHVQGRLPDNDQSDAGINAESVTDVSRSGELWSAQVRDSEVCNARTPNRPMNIQVPGRRRAHVSRDRMPMRPCAHVGLLSTARAAYLLPRELIWMPNYSAALPEARR
ncbi:hypothetical protein [Burkholderia cepacia]|uniref:hypothetical protein n=1 Tax=Burkholderia cepacia TaxID=292 RepID=UPI0012D98CE8|nr:hypothetical protein [Burkholderia cepacia]